MLASGCSSACRSFLADQRQCTCMSSKLKNVEHCVLISVQIFTNYKKYYKHDNLSDLYFKEIWMYVKNYYSHNYHYHQEIGDNHTAFLFNLQVDLKCSNFHVFDKILKLLAFLMPTLVSKEMYEGTYSRLHQRDRRRINLKTSGTCLSLNFFGL